MIVSGQVVAGAGLRVGLGLREGRPAFTTFAVLRCAWTRRPSMFCQ
jgi:hypothetical protein